MPLYDFQKLPHVSLRACKQTSCNPVILLHDAQKKEMRKENHGDLKIKIISFTNKLQKNNENHYFLYLIILCYSFELICLCGGSRNFILTVLMFELPTIMQVPTNFFNGWMNFE